MRVHGAAGPRPLFFHPGEVLLGRAVVGLVFLLPFSFAPRWIALAAGWAGTAVGAGCFTGGLAVVPGPLAPDAAVLLVPWAFGALWLRRFDRGPLVWCRRGGRAAGQRNQSLSWLRQRVR